VKDDGIYLWHIRDCIERILDYTTDGRDTFLADPKTQDAVIRNLEYSITIRSGRLFSFRCFENSRNVEVSPRGGLSFDVLRIAKKVKDPRSARACHCAYHCFCLLTAQKQIQY
jgi:hypothetical protein